MNVETDLQYSSRAQRFKRASSVPYKGLVGTANERILWEKCQPKTTQSLTLKMILAIVATSEIRTPGLASQFKKVQEICV